MRKRFARGLLVLGISIAIAGQLAACGRTLPAADPEAAAEHKAILLITSHTLDEAAAQKWETALRHAREENKVAYEQINGASSIDADLMERIRSRPYDRIVVAGNDLLPSAMDAANKTPDKRWVFLQERYGQLGAATAKKDSVQLISFDPKIDSDRWDAWVRGKTEAGAVIQWIARQNRPVPSVWAPSEEADHIVDLDVFGGSWFTQLAFQVQSTGATDIAVYTPLSQAELQKLKTLHLSVTDLTVAPDIRPDWDKVAGEVIKDVVSDHFEPGNRFYAGDETASS